MNFNNFNKTAIYPKDLFNRTFSLVNYLLTHQVVLGDWDFVDLTEVEKIQVQYTTLEHKNILQFGLTLEQVKGV